MTEFLVFLALGLTVLVIAQWLDDKDRRDARRRNQRRHIR